MGTFIDTVTSKRFLKRVFFYVFVSLFVLTSVLPLLWIFKMSIVDRAELFTVPPTIWPESTTWSSYKTIFADSRFRRALLNSIVVAGSTTIICLTLGSLAAYAIARLRFSLRNITLTLILAISFFPPVVLIAPLFLQFAKLEIINTYLAIIVPDTVFALPLTIWLLVAFFKELPRDLEDAAKVDGATPLQAFWKIMLPLAAPGVFTTAILTFIFAWNEFLFANTFAFDQSTQTATVVIPSFATIYTTDYGAQAAAAVVVTVPLVLVVLVLQRKIISGLTAGAIKG